MAVSARKILIVDDDRVSRLSLARMLQRELGLTIVESENGLQAWSILQADSDIDMVISDWVMPGCDGIQLTQLIRSGRRGRYTYVILLTSKSEHADLLSAMEAGADEYLTKPFDPMELKLRVRAGLRIITLEDTLRDQNLELEAAYNELADGISAAQRVQDNLLLAVDDLSEIRKRHQIEVDYVYRACQNLGGDVVGVQELPDTRLGVFLADVSGHGLAASMSAFSLHAYIRSHLPVVSDPLQLMRDANVFCCRQFPEEVYATMVYMVLDSRSGETDLVVAGHPPVFHLRQGRIIGEFESTMPPLGMFTELEMPEAPDRLVLYPGESIFAYTDGIIETRNPAGDFFSRENLVEALMRASTMPGRQTDQVMAVLAQWRGNDDIIEDDVTLISLTRQ